MKFKKPDWTNWLVAAMFLTLAFLAGKDGSVFAPIIMVGAALYELFVDQKIPEAWGGDGVKTESSIRRNNK